MTVLEHFNRIRNFINQLIVQQQHKKIKRKYLSQFTDAADVSIASCLLTNQLTRTSLTDTETAKKVIPYILSLRNIIGVQPLSGPVGLVYKMITEELNQEPDTNIKRREIRVESQGVTATSRKCQHVFNNSTLEDIEALHGISSTDIIKDTAATSVTMGINSYILNKLISANDHNLICNNKNIIDAIRNASIDIATSSLRGFGNFVLTSSEGAELIKSSCDANQVVQYEALQSLTDNSSISNITHVGNLFGVNANKNGMKVFVVSDPILEGKMVVGYKGASEIDTGYIYCPYVITQTYTHATKSVRDDSLVDTNVGVLVRGTDATFGDIEKYYRTINIVSSTNQ